MGHRSRPSWSRRFSTPLRPRISTLDEVLAQRQREHHRLETYHQQQVSQARYEATLARRRYEHVDPAYRLAAAALEHEWDDKLRAYAKPKKRPSVLPTNRASRRPWSRHQLLTLSQRLPDLWQSSHLRHEQRKALLRSLIARVIVTDG